MIGIYKITNKNDGKVYIGQSTNIRRRLSEHKRKRVLTIDDYINIFGVENFEFEVVEECLLEELDAKEKYYISYYNSQENGYNHQGGGFNNSQGSGNGRALLSEQDVIMMRKAYAEHRSPKDVYELVKYTGITKNAFQAAWQGQSWSTIMPEVFTPENKNYYATQICKEKNSIFTEQEVIKYRTYYIDHPAKEVYQRIIQDKGEGFTTFGTVKKMLCGDGKKSNYYQEIPIYNKKHKRWELYGEPVSTIPGSGE
jgi:group I intron endonuclease